MYILFEEVVPKLKAIITFIAKSQVSENELKQCQTTTGNIWNTISHFKVRECIVDILVLLWKDPSMRQKMESCRLLTRVATDYIGIEKFKDAHRCMSDFEKFFETFGNGIDGMTVEKEKDRARGIVFNYLLVQIEICVQSADFSKAVGFVGKIKLWMHEVPQEVHRLMSLEYSVARKFWNCKKYGDAVPWLREALELNKIVVDKDLSSKLSVDCLDLLAFCLGELGKIDDALDCISRSIEIASGPRAYHLQLKLLVDKGSASVGKCLMDYVTKANTIPELLKGIDIVVHTKAAVHCQDAFRFLLGLYPDGEDNILFRFCIFESYIFGFNDQSKAIDYLKLIVRDIMSSNVSIPKEYLDRFQTRLWKLATEAITAHDYSSSLLWFGYALRMMVPTDSVNRAKALRFIAQSHLESNQIVDAETAVRNSLELHPTSFQGLYILFRVLVLQTKVEEATFILNQLVLHENFLPEYYYTFGHLAFEKGINVLTVRCLENLIKQPEVREYDRIIQTLVNLALKGTNMQQVVNYMNNLCLRIEKLGVDQVLPLTEKPLINWFVMTAWNQGTAASKTGLHNLAYDFFKVSGFLSSKADGSLVLKSLMNRIYSITAHAKSNPSESLLQQGLGDCKELLKQISLDKDLSTRQIRDSSDPKSFALAQEFIISLALGLPDTQIKGFLEQCLKDGMSASFFSQLGAAAFEGAQKKPEIAQECFKKALFVCMNESVINVKESLDLYIRLIQLCQKKDNSFGFFDDILRMCKNSVVSDEISEQLRWIVAECWNNGVYFNKMMNQVKGEQWMKMAFSLSCLLEDKDAIRSKVSSSYQKMLEKLGRNGIDRIQEEIFV